MDLLFIKYPFNFGKSFIKFKKLLQFYEIPLFVKKLYKNFIYIFALSIYDMLQNRLICLVGTVVTNGLVEVGSIPCYIISKTLKIVLDTSLLKTQQYKVHIMGKVE